MNEKTKMMLNEGMLLWAFGCAVDHYDIAAFAIALASIWFTVHIYDMEDIKRLLLKALLAADLCLIIAYMTGLSAVIPAVGIVIAANSFYALMTSLNPYRLMDQAVRIFTAILLVYTALTFISPQTQFTFGQLLSLILLIFAPVLIVYAVRVFMDDTADTYHGGKLTNDVE